MISIIDYGAGNIGSVLNMIRHLNCPAEAINDSASVVKATKIILPGVGSFDSAMSRLRLLGLVEPLKARILAGVPLLGICLGMQLLANDSDEGSMAGLGVIPGKVRRFSFDTDCQNLKIPHMGWNTVTSNKVHPLGAGLDVTTRFYFVHSYYFDCLSDENVLFKSFYGHEFSSGVQKNNVMGVQFHPEKSHRHGKQLLRNFIGL